MEDGRVRRKTDRLPAALAVPTVHHHPRHPEQSGAAPRAPDAILPSRVRLHLRRRRVGRCRRQRILRPVVLRGAAAHVLVHLTARCPGAAEVACRVDVREGSRGEHALIPSGRHSPASHATIPSWVIRRRSGPSAPFVQGAAQDYFLALLRAQHRGDQSRRHQLCRDDAGGGAARGSGARWLRAARGPAAACSA